MNNRESLDPEEVNPEGKHLSPSLRPKSFNRHKTLEDEVIKVLDLAGPVEDGETNRIMYQPTMGDTAEVIQYSARTMG